jgi:TolA-binding protein
VETGEISALQRNVADLTANYDQVKSDLVSATTRADETKVQLQKEIAQLGEKVAEKTAKVEEINRRVVTLEEKMERVAAASPVSSAAPAPVPQDWKSPEEMYDYAVGLIKGGETGKGRQLLTAFASKYPDHKLLPNVFYWKGEAFYAEKDYENAILSFQDVVDKYPGGTRRPTPCTSRDSPSWRSRTGRTRASCSSWSSRNTRSPPPHRLHGRNYPN